MRVRATLMPGQHGTKQLVEQYGDQLVCVRYRYDETHKRRIKTVELIVEDLPWIREVENDVRFPRPARKRIQDVLVHVNYQETNLRSQVKQAGGLWMKDEKAWRINHEIAIQLGLEKRIIKLIDVDELGF